VEVMVAGAEEEEEEEEHELAAWEWCRHQRHQASVVTPRVVVRSAPAENTRAAPALSVLVVLAPLEGAPPAGELPGRREELAR
jgi:hypothetical protein